MTAAEHYTRNVVINQYEWTKELSWLTSPIVASAVLTLIAIVVMPRFISLRGGAPGMTLARLAGLTVAFVLAVTGPAGAATAPLDVSLSRTAVSTRLGESFGFSSEVRNTGTTARPGWSRT